MQTGTNKSFVMSKRYSIMVNENGSTKDIELAQVDTNPAEVAKGAARMTLGKGNTRVSKYSQVWVIDNENGRVILRY